MFSWSCCDRVIVLRYSCTELPLICAGATGSLNLSTRVPSDYRLKTLSKRPFLFPVSRNLARDHAQSVTWRIMVTSQRPLSAPMSPHGVNTAHPRTQWRRAQSQSGHLLHGHAQPPPSSILYCVYLLCCLRVCNLYADYFCTHRGATVNKPETNDMVIIARWPLVSHTAFSYSTYLRTTDDTS